MVISTYQIFQIYVNLFQESICYLTLTLFKNYSCLFNFGVRLFGKHHSCDNSGIAFGDDITERAITMLPLKQFIWACVEGNMRVYIDLKLYHLLSERYKPMPELPCVYKKVWCQNNWQATEKTACAHITRNNTKRWYNVVPTSATLARRCANVLADVLWFLGFHSVIIVDLHRLLSTLFFCVLYIYLFDISCVLSASVSVQLSLAPMFTPSAVPFARSVQACADVSVKHQWGWNKGAGFL